MFMLISFLLSVTNAMRPGPAPSRPLPQAQMSAKAGVEPALTCGRATALSGGVEPPPADNARQTCDTCGLRALFRSVLPIEPLRQEGRLTLRRKVAVSRRRGVFGLLNVPLSGRIRDHCPGSRCARVRLDGARLPVHVEPGARWSLRRGSNPHLRRSRAHSRWPSRTTSLT